MACASVRECRQSVSSATLSLVPPGDVLGEASEGTRSVIGLRRLGGVAIGVGVCAGVAVAVAYPGLPPVLPVSRWQMEPKSPVIALRVPLINLAMIGLALVAWRATARPEPRIAQRIGPILVATAVAKAVLEAAALVTEPTPSPLLAGTLLACVFAGIVACIITGRDLVPTRWRSIHPTTGEKRLAVGLIASVLLLDIPLVL
jgi:hypothetical protein